MYARAAIKPNPLLRNGAYGIVMRGVQKCTRGCSSLRGRNRLPLCCIKLDTATEIIVPYMIQLRFGDFVKECKNLLIYRLSDTEGCAEVLFFACHFRQTILNVCRWVFTLVILHTLITMKLPITIYRTICYRGVHVVNCRALIFNDSNDLH